MFHTNSGLRLTPSYDQVAASLYNYKTRALKIAGSKDHSIGDLKGRHLTLLGEEFGLSSSTGWAVCFGKIEIINLFAPILSPEIE